MNMQPPTTETKGDELLGITLRRGDFMSSLAPKGLIW
jgi:hypothetical protein